MSQGIRKTNMKAESTQQKKTGQMDSGYEKFTDSLRNTWPSKDLFGLKRKKLNKVLKFSKSE